MFYLRKRNYLLEVMTVPSILQPSQTRVKERKTFSSIEVHLFTCEVKQNLINHFTTDF